MILVSRGIILKEGRILAAQRPPEMSLAFLWELPGGKKREGESITECLCREIREEFGIEIRVIGPAGDPVEREHRGNLYRMIPVLGEFVSGEVELKEHLQVRWLPADRLGLLEWAPADLEIVKRWMQPLAAEEMKAIVRNPNFR